MAKIPTYESRRVPSGNVARPNLPDYSVNIANKLVSASNKVLDAKAIDEGYKAGKEEQAKQFVEDNTLVERSGYTLRNEAFNKGANAAYVVGMKNKADTELNKLATELNDPMSKVSIDERMNIYNTRKEELRNNFVTDLPSHLQGDLTGYFDSQNEKYASQVFNNQRNLQVNEIKTTIAGRVDTALENLPALIRDFGFKDNEELVEQFSDIFAAIDEGLGTISPALAEQYKEKLRTTIQYSALENAYQNAEDKEAFIEDLESGGDKYKEVMAEINETYFEDQDQIELTANGDTGYKTLAKRLRVDLKNDKADMAVDRALWEQDAKGALALFKSGVNPNYQFDAEQMKALGFSDTAILNYQTQFAIAEEIYPDIIEARSTAPNDNTTTLKSLTKEFNDLSVKENKTEEDRDRLIILSAQIDGIGTIVSNQKKYIADGDINLLFDQAGIEYDTSTPEGILAYHNKAISQFGLDESLMKVVPQGQLDADAELMTTGTFADVMALQGKYGKYFEKFVADAGLVKEGYQTVAIFAGSNPNYAEQIFNAINDMEGNIKSAKQIDDGFSGEGGALDTFTAAFQTEYLDFLRGNQDMANDITNAAQALFIQTYLRTGDIAKAQNSILKNFDQNFTKFDYNGMKVLLPINVDQNEIRTKIDEFAKHPQKFGIHTSNMFDINDFKDDFEDNTYDNYTLAVDGGAIKIINKENAMGVVTIFKKLPSATGEMTVTNSIVLNEGDNVEHLESKDTVDVWEYNDVNLTEIVDNEITELESTQIGSNDEVASLENEIAGIEKQMADLTAKSKVPEMLETILRPLQDKVLMLEQRKDELLENQSLSTAEKVEKVLFAYSSLENKPLDTYVGTITSDASVQPHLHAISVYIKGGQMNEWVIEALSEIEAFKGLTNDAIATEVLLNWQDNMNRTTNTKPPTRMTPIQALYDFVRDLEEENTTTSNNNNNDMTYGEVLMGLD